MHFLHPTESLAYALVFSSTQILKLSDFCAIVNTANFGTDMLAKYRSYLRNIPITHDCQGRYTPLSVIVTCEPRDRDADDEAVTLVMTLITHPHHCSSIVTELCFV